MGMGIFRKHRPIGPRSTQRQPQELQAQPPYGEVRTGGFGSACPSGPGVHSSRPHPSFQAQTSYFRRARSRKPFSLWQSRLSGWPIRHASNPYGCHASPWALRHGYAGMGIEEE